MLSFFQSICPQICSVIRSLLNSIYQRKRINYLFHLRFLEMIGMYFRVHFVAGGFRFSGPPPGVN